MDPFLPNILQKARGIAQGNALLEEALGLFVPRLMAPETILVEVDMSVFPEVGSDEWEARQEEFNTMLQDQVPGILSSIRIDHETYESLRQRDRWKTAFFTISPERGRIQVVPAYEGDLDLRMNTAIFAPVNGFGELEETAWVLKIFADSLTPGWRGIILLEIALFWCELYFPRGDVDRRLFKYYEELQRFKCSDSEFVMFLARAEISNIILGHLLRNQTLGQLPKGSTASMDVVRAVRDESLKDLKNMFGPPLSETEEMHRYNSTTLASIRRLLVAPIMQQVLRDLHSAAR